MTQQITATPGAEAEAEAVAKAAAEAAEAIKKATAVAIKPDKEVTAEEWMQRAKSAEGRIATLGKENEGLAGLAAQIGKLTTTVQGVVAQQGQTQSAITFLTETVSSEALTPEQVKKRDDLQASAEKLTKDNLEAKMYQNQISKTLLDAGVKEGDPLVQPIIETFNNGRYAEASALANMINIVKKITPQAAVAEVTPATPKTEPKPKTNPVKPMTPESKSAEASDGIFGKARIQRAISTRASDNQ